MVNHQSFVLLALLWVETTHWWSMVALHKRLIPWETMMTSSKGNIFRVIGPLRVEFTDHRWIPHAKATDAEIWCSFDLRLNKRLSK